VLVGVEVDGTRRRPGVLRVDVLAGVEHDLCRDRQVVRVVGLAGLAIVGNRAVLVGVIPVFAVVVTAVVAAVVAAVVVAAVVVATLVVGVATLIAGAVGLGRLRALGGVVRGVTATVVSGVVSGVVALARRGVVALARRGV